MSTEEAIGIVALAKRADMSIGDIAKCLGCAPRTISHWRSGRVNSVGEAVARNLRALRDELKKGAKK